MVLIAPKHPTGNSQAFSLGLYLQRGGAHGSIGSVGQPSALYRSATPSVRVGTQQRYYLRKVSARLLHHNGQSAASGGRRLLLAQAQAIPVKEQCINIKVFHLDCFPHCGICKVSKAFVIYHLILEARKLKLNMRQYLWMLLLSGAAALDLGPDYAHSIEGLSLYQVIAINHR